MSPEIVGFAERLEAQKQSDTDQPQVQHTPLTAIRRGSLHRPSPLSRYLLITARARRIASKSGS